MAASVSHEPLASLPPVRSDKSVTQWMKHRAVVHAVIVGLFVVPMLTLLLIDSSRNDLLGKARWQYDAWENASIDQRIRFGRTAKVSSDIVFLAIDAPSIKISSVEGDEALQASKPLSMMDSFPYPHDLYPLICDRLFGAGAKVVAFDLFFPTPKPEDVAFQATIDKYRDQLVMGMNFSDDGLRTNDNAHHTQMDVSGNFLSLNLPSASLFPDQDPYNQQLAYLNFWPDTDEVIRAAQYRTNQEMINHQQGAEKLPPLFSLAARMAQKAGYGDRIPDNFASHTFRYAGPPLKAFNSHSYSLYQIFDPHAWKDNFNNGEVFKGKIVLVGPQGNVLKDQLRTPYDLMDGAEIHLNALNALLQKDYLHHLPDWSVKVIVIGAGLIAYLLAMGIGSIAWRFAAVVLIETGYLGVGISLYNGPGYLVPAVAPMGVLAGSAGVGFVYDFLLAQLERLRLRTTFERYTSPNVAKYLLDHSANYQEMMAGARKPVTVLFSDVRGFTTLSETSDSQELVAKLNEYLTAMVGCVFRHDGSLDKFIGDAVMAVWGNTPYNFGPREDAVRAVRAALNMMAELRALNARWTKEGKTEWRIGIGLNHGEAIVGDMGSPQRKEFAVIGDAVNLASRLEGLTKEYHVDILIGESVADLVRDQFHLRTVDLVQVKGKTKAVQTFAVLAEKAESLSPERRKFLDAYEDAIAAFRDRRFNQARELFLAALQIEPDDSLSISYLKACDEYIQNPPDADWTGIRVMTKK